MGGVNLKVSLTINKRMTDKVIEIEKIRNELDESSRKAKESATRISKNRNTCAMIRNFLVFSFILASDVAIIVEYVGFRQRDVCGKYLDVECIVENIAETPYGFNVELKTQFGSSVKYIATNYRSVYDKNKDHEFVDYVYKVGKVYSCGVDINTHAIAFFDTYVQLPCENALKSHETDFIFMIILSSIVFCLVVLHIGSFCTSFMETRRKKIIEEFVKTQKVEEKKDIETGVVSYNAAPSSAIV